MERSVKKSALFVLVLAFVLTIAFGVSSMRNLSYATINQIVIKGDAYDSSKNQSGSDWSWDAANKRLTLKNFSYNGTSHPIWLRNAANGDEVTIYLVGSNHIYGAYGDGAIKLGDDGNNAGTATYIIDGDENAVLGIDNHRGTSGNYTEAFWLKGDASRIIFKGGDVKVAVEGAYSPSAVFCDRVNNVTNQSVEIQGGRFEASVTCTNATETAMIFRNQISLGIRQFDFMRLDAQNTKDSSKAQICNSSIAETVNGAVTKAAEGSLSKTSKVFRGTKLAKVTRIYGSSRYDTSLKVARYYNEAKGRYAVSSIVVASGANYPDALAGGYLAKVKGAPMILVDGSNESKVLKYIDDEAPSTVYILGGTGAVSKNFEDKAKAILGEDGGVVRLGGKSRYDTNQAILKEAKVDESYNGPILICTGTGFADSLSASATALPILLVDGKNFTAEQKALCGRTQTRSFYLIGGEGVVSNVYKTYIEKTWNDCTVDRLGGANRYETSQLVADEFCKGTHNDIVLAYAQNFPDGLSGGPLAMAYNAPLILVDSANVSGAQKYAKAHGSQRVIILGGPALISDAAAQKIF